MAIILPNFNNKIINITAVNITFPDDAELNLTAFDMGESLVSISFDGKAVERLPVAVGNIGSAKMYRNVSCGVSINKLSVMADVWHKRALNSAIIKGVTGSCVITDDVGKEYKIFVCSIDLTDINAAGNEGAYNFTIDGIIPVNQDLYGTITVG